MEKERYLVVGSGGREASIVRKLVMEGCCVYAYMSHENPGIMDLVERSNGCFTVGDVYDGKKVADYAVKNNITYCIVNNDNILAAGVVDELRKRNVPTFGPTKEGAKIEWSKSFTRDLGQKVDDSISIKYSVIQCQEELDDAKEKFKDIDIVVKPDGLTGGKGVKVMGEHFKNQAEAFLYAKELLDCDGKVVIEEKVEGFEFTIMGFTDGKKIVVAPVTYDYPYRYDNDQGPGTGGMGCFTTESGVLPCLTAQDILTCKLFMEKIVHEINQHENIFNGVINGGFFKKKDGSIKLMEFNARLGDPECLNIMEVLDTDLSCVVKKCINGELSETYCNFKNNAASVVVYLVSKDYALSKEKNENTVFEVNEAGLLKEGCYIIYGSCMRKNEKYHAIGSSRLAAIVTSGKTLEEARKRVYVAIKSSISGNVEYREDIASIKKIDEMEHYCKGD